MSVPEAEAFAEVIEVFTLKAVPAQPANVTTLQTGVPAGYSSLALPGEGNLWINFSYQGQPEAKAWLWDQIKLFTPIKPNEPQVLPYRKGDRLVFKLGFPTQEITLSWGYE